MQRTTRGAARTARERMRSEQAMLVEEDDKADSEDGLSSSEDDKEEASAILMRTPSQLTGEFVYLAKLAAQSGRTPAPPSRPTRVGPDPADNVGPAKRKGGRKTRKSAAASVHMHFPLVAGVAAVAIIVALVAIPAPQGPLSSKFKTHAIFKNLRNANHEAALLLSACFDGPETGVPQPVLPCALTVVATEIEDFTIATSGLRLAGILSRYGVRNMTWTSSFVALAHVGTNGHDQESLQSLLYRRAAEDTDQGHVWVIKADQFAPSGLAFLGRVLKRGLVVDPKVAARALPVKNFVFLLHTTSGSKSVISLMKTRSQFTSAKERQRAHAKVHDALADENWDVNVRVLAPLVLTLR